MKLENCVLMRASNDRFGMTSFVFAQWEKVLQEHFEGVLPIDETAISGVNGWLVKEILDQANSEWLFIIGDERACQKAAELQETFKGTKYKFGIFNFFSEDGMDDMHSLMFMFIEEQIREQMYNHVKRILENKECATKKLILELPNTLRDQLVADITVAVQTKYKLTPWQPNVVTLLHSVDTTVEELHAKLEEVGTENVLILAGKNHRLIDEAFHGSDFVEKIVLQLDNFSTESAMARYVENWIKAAYEKMYFLERSFWLDQMPTYFPCPIVRGFSEWGRKYRYSMHPSYEKRMETTTPGLVLEEDKK